MEAAIAATSAIAELVPSHEVTAPGVGCIAAVTRALACAIPAAAVCDTATMFCSCDCAAAVSPAPPAPAIVWAAALPICAAAPPAAPAALRRAEMLDVVGFAAAAIVAVAMLAAAVCPAAIAAVIWPRRP